MEQVGLNSKRRSRQKGSAALEAALVILPTMALCFALLDFPLMIFIQNSVENAVREGVRFAITQQTGAQGQDSAIKGVVKTYSMGFINDAAISAGNASINIQYYDPTLNPVAGGGSNAGGNIVVVTATVKRFWMVPIYVDANLDTYAASSADMMEAPAGGTPPAR
jgi:Flp pilus assembly protein TadG